MVVAFCVHFLVALHKGEFPELLLSYVQSCRAPLCTSAKQIEFGFTIFVALFLCFRLNTAQIPCPEPIMLRSHVLVMGFIGKGDR